MVYDADKHHRRSVRLTGYDYGQAGAYFVTICTYCRESIFGDIVDDKLQLSTIGEIAVSCWQEIPQHFEGVLLDEYVVMPNHTHGILWIGMGRGTIYRAPLASS